MKKIDGKRNSNFFILGVGILAIGVIFYFTRFRTYANINNPFVKNILFSTLQLDDSAYGDTYFDSNNLDFRTILDKNVENSLDNVIYISFLVGGNEKNDAEEPIYDIALQDLEIDCDLLSPYVKWKLLKNGEEISNGSFDYHFDTIKNGRLVLTPIQQDLKKYSEDKNDYDHYDFYLWLSDSCQEDSISKCENSESQNFLLGKRLSGQIEVELYSKTKLELVRNPSDELDTSTCIVSE